MKRKRIFLGFAVITFVSVCLLIFAIGPTLEFFKPFKRFTVTVDNQSDYEVMSIETGIIQRESKDLYANTIKSGQKKKIKPDLKHSGEGAIYLKFTDSRGQTKEETVCSYTEYLSGYSTITIYNDRTAVVEKCN